MALAMTVDSTLDSTLSHAVDATLHRAHSCQRFL